jgi:hypothetical protein
VNKYSTARIRGLGAELEDHPRWRKAGSSASDCIEVAFVSMWLRSSFDTTDTAEFDAFNGAAVRDSKNPRAGVLTFPKRALRTLIRLSPSLSHQPH